MRPVIRLNNAIQAIHEYSVKEPLSSHLNRYFKKNKNIGSKDRKELRSIVYHYFRLGRVQNQLDIKTCLILSHFLCSDKTDEFLDYWLPEISGLKPEQVTDSKKLKFLAIQDEFQEITLHEVFPLLGEISDEIDNENFVYSLFEQPLVYFFHFFGRTRDLERELLELKIPFSKKGRNCFCVKPETSLEKVEAYNKGELIIQDMNVQQTLKNLDFKKDEKWWDCCAGSGGKSLAMKYKSPELDLWVSDSRKSILENLDKRFHQVNIEQYHSAKINLTEEVPDNFPEFDGILMDAPCSGSGTWSRTPEQIITTSSKSISRYKKLQMQIAENVISKLKPGGKFIYITCSVFYKENENVVKWLRNTYGLEILSTDYFPGYNEKAETLFRAVLLNKA